MAPFLALIHDFQHDRRTLYAHIAEQIGEVDTYRQQNNSLNAVLIERDFDQESRRIDEQVVSYSVSRMRFSILLRVAYQLKSYT